MSKKTIEAFMTPFPHGIHSGMPLKTARDLMRKYEIRHLPVLLAGHLVGVLTDRDLKLGASFDHEGTLTVEDVMTPDPFCVGPAESIAAVATEMGKHKYGCAIVQDDKGKVIGIFTATDALKLLGKTLSPARPKSRAKPKRLTKKEGKYETHRNLD